MNKVLLENIVRHVYEGFLIIPSDHVNNLSSQKLLSTEFILDKQLKFEYEEGEIFGKVWGCQILTEDHGIKILCGDTSDSDSKEYAMIVCLKNSLTYGLYSVFNKDRIVDQEAMIAVSADGKAWLECNTGLQGSFLAGMEQLKELGVSLTKCTNYKLEFEYLKSFINFHDTIYGDDNAGQEI